MSRRRVVITGLGAVTPVGNSVESSWKSVKEGRCGAGPITLFDASGFQVRIAAEVKGFSLDDYGVDHKLSRKMSRFAKFLLGAGIQAVTDAGYTKENFSAENTGIVSGVGIGISDVVEIGYRKYLDPSAGVNRLRWRLTMRLRRMSRCITEFTVPPGLFLRPARPEPIPSVLPAT